jgi:SAM-dependent methyltransferase
VDAPDSAARLCTGVLQEVNGRIEALLRRIARPGADATLLDVGCWDGRFTIGRGEAFGAERLLGVEVFPEAVEGAIRRGIEVARLDLEVEPLPWPDESVDAVVCNQVLEHLKNIWLPLSEMHRVLRPGGHAVLSVPNLASLHNRVLLALGRQPTSIRTFGPHVRGYTLREFRELVGRDGAFEIEASQGAGFYPLPSPWSRGVSRLWAGGSHTIVVLAQRTDREAPWRRYLAEQEGEGVQTFYAEGGAAS